MNIKLKSSVFFVILHLINVTTVQSYYVSPLLHGMLRTGKSISDIIGWTQIEPWLLLMWMIHVCIFVLFCFVLQILK